MKFEVEYHPDMFVFLPTVAVAWVKEDVYCAQAGLLFWTVSLTFRA